MANRSMAIQPGFDDPVTRSQQVFREVLEAMARPGTIRDLDGLGFDDGELSPAAMAVALALIDFETPVWLDEAASGARETLVFHCGCPVTADPARAAFAIVGEPALLEGFGAFNTGSDEYPERSTTLILDIGCFEEDDGNRIVGPGIRESLRFAPGGVAENFWDEVRSNRLLFPRGVDLILACGNRVAALPRTVRVED